MKIKKFLFPFRYREDMKKVKMLLETMNTEHCICQEASEKLDHYSFIRHAKAFDNASKQVSNIYKKWGITE